MPKTKAKKKKKVSYETRVRRLKVQRANLSEEQKQKIKDYNRARSLKARANESPGARELRLQKSRETARVRRSKRKAQVQKEMRKLGIIPPSKQLIPTPLDPTHPLFLNFAAQMMNPGNNNLPSDLMNFRAHSKDLKLLGSNPGKNDRHLPNKIPLPFINYKPAFPIHMSMPQVSMNEDFDDMATVCPIECNVDISPEPVQKFKQPAKSISVNNDEIVKNIGAHVVIKKKVVNKLPPQEDARLHTAGGPSDWNGTASVCPIECNVDITDPSEPVQKRADSNNPTSAMKRNSLLDSLKQMGTHVIIKKKGELCDKNPSLKSSSSKNDVTRILPVECNVDIKPVESRLKNSEITIVKHNGSSNMKKLGSQIMMQKVPKPVPVQQRGYESPEEAYDDYDMPCPIECNVDISESS